MLEVKNLRKAYNNIIAVNDLSFNVYENEIVGFIGPNGSGKSTTLKMLSNIILPDNGNIILDNINILDNIKYKQLIAFQADNPDMMLRLKGIEYLNFICDIFKVSDRTNIKKYSDLFELTDYLNKPIMDYSHGMRQKLMTISSLIHNPKLWILDEPLMGLDPKSTHILKELMTEHKNKGNSVIFSTHILEVAEKLCDRIIIIFNGNKLFEGKIEELLNLYNNKSLEEIYLILTNECN